MSVAGAAKLMRAREIPRLALSPDEAAEFLESVRAVYAHDLQNLQPSRFSELQRTPNLRARWEA